MPSFLSLSFIYLFLLSVSLYRSLIHLPLSTRTESLLCVSPNKSGISTCSFFSSQTSFLGPFAVLFQHRLVASYLNYSNVLLTKTKKIIQKSYLMVFSTLLFTSCLQLLFLQPQSWVAGTTWPTKSRLYIIWSFTRKVCWTKL